MKDDIGSEKDKKEEKKPFDKTQGENKSSEKTKKECPCPDCECEKCECEEGKECVCKNKKCKDCDCDPSTGSGHAGSGHKKEKELQEKLEECEFKYKRALADYQNLEKRVRDERIEWIKTANRDLIFRMLPVLDTLMLAQHHANDKTIAVTIQQFLDVLKAEGVEKIKTEGEEFSPHVMEVISTEEVDPSTGSGQLENKVLKETRSGYKIGDRVLRVAQVVVGKKE